MASVRGVLRALTRLDDRVLGRWLDRPPPRLSVAITMTVLLVLAAVLLTVLLGDATPLKAASFGVLVGWIARFSLRRPR
ncbi:hypothetical protein [Actinoallomurus sp. CA-142502]|uniref:hypothetical protein n=1 Tax=Actinoallomurus sp. CA-142502 TaxID=3239885 RepID=UPI003D94FF23